jgi:hypothetical protein
MSAIYDLMDALSDYIKDEIEDARATTGESGAWTPISRKEELARKIADAILARLTERIAP